MTRTLLVLGLGVLVTSGAFAQVVASDRTVPLPASAIDVVSSRTWLDFDNDGLEDLFVSDPIDGDRLLRNRGDGALDDATDRANIRASTVTRHASWVDPNADGRLDLFRLTITGSVQLLENHTDGMFRDVTTSLRLDPSLVVKAVGWNDVDRDGRPDVLISAAGHLMLCRNGPSGRFRPSEFPFDLSTSDAGSATLPICLWTDYNLDRELDVFVLSATSAPHLLRGRPDGGFDDVTEAARIATDSAVAGEWVAETGPLPHLRLTMADGHAVLYRNRGDGSFERVAFRLVVDAGPPLTEVPTPNSAPMTPGAPSTTPVATPLPLPSAAVPGTTATRTPASSASLTSSGGAAVPPAPPTSPLDLLYINDNSPNSVTPGLPEVEGGDDTSRANDIKDGTVHGTDLALTLNGNRRFSGQTLVVDATNGRIGVGTSAPAQLLDVNGNAILGEPALGRTYITGRSINGGYDTNGPHTLIINEVGYNGYVLQPRDFEVWNGQGARIARFLASPSGFQAFGRSELDFLTIGKNGSGGLDVIGNTTVQGDLITSGFIMSPGNPGYVMTSDASGRGTWQQPSGLGGSGSDNYLARWNGTSAIENSVIYEDDAHNVGIGTSSPTQQLTVLGRTALRNDNGVGLSVDCQQAGSDAIIANSNQGRALFAASGDVIVGQGNLGVRTTSASYPLTVVGDGSVAAGEHLVAVLQTGAPSGVGGPSLGYRADGTNVTSILFRAPDNLAMTFGTRSVNQAVTITDGGNVGIGTSAPTGTLDVQGRALVTNSNGAGLTVTSTNGDAITAIGNSGRAIWAATGDVVVSTGNVGIGQSNPTNILQIVQNSATDPIADDWKKYSSRRWKKDIEALEDALEKVCALRGVSFTWRGTDEKGIGFIAEEVGRILPEVVEYEANGIDARGMSYDTLTALLVEAIKAQQGEIDELRAEMTALKRMASSGSCADGVR